MLLLIRRPGESVFLTDSRTGETIGEVKLIAVAGEHARIGFEFPTHIAIKRDNMKHDRKDNSHERLDR